MTARRHRRGANPVARVRRRRAAFSLIELVTAMVILATVGLTIGVVVPTAVIGFRDNSVRAQLMEEATTTIARLTTELRNIPLDTSLLPTIAPHISSATTTSLAWNTNWSLSLSSTNLMLTEAGGTSTLLQPNVSALTLACYNESNAALPLPLSGSACAQIRRIEIQITLTRDGVSQSLRTRAFLRACVAGAGA